MGQKIPPRALRLEINEDWRSSWYAQKVGASSYARYVALDMKLRQMLKSRLAHACVTDISTELMNNNKIIVNIVAAKPGVVIGKRGVEIDYLRKKIAKDFGVDEVVINVEELRKPEASAEAVAQRIATKLGERAPWRQVMKFALRGVQKAQVSGVYICLKGRISQIARAEKVREGRVPRQTLRSKIEDVKKTAFTRSGTVGVHVSICHDNQVDLMAQRGAK